MKKRYHSIHLPLPNPSNHQKNIFLTAKINVAYTAILFMYFIEINLKFVATIHYFSLILAALLLVVVKLFLEVVYLQQQTQLLLPQLLL